jgi:hemolysin III
VPRFEQSADNSVSTNQVREEYFNAVTHGLGLLLTLVGAIAIFALGRTGDHGYMIVGQVYLVTLVAVYGISTLSHWVQKPRLKLSLQTWDQGTIYLLISGTYTPFVWKYMEIEWRWFFLSVIWAVALLGFSSKVLARYRVLEFSSRSYVLFGWLPALAMVNLVPWICVIWMALGGISYTVGTFFLWLDHRYRYFHAIWHLFVIVGSGLHYYAIYRFILLPNAMG